MTSITSPVEGFTGITHFGPLAVEFKDGKAAVDDLPDGIRDYMLSAGYKVGSKKGTVVTTLDGATITEPVVDSRDVNDILVGTELRDAAVDPEPGDFLAPVNAGKADPHGPTVVAPEIHASEGVRPIKGGEVHVGDPTIQDKAEKAHAKEATDGTPIVVTEAEKTEQPVLVEAQPEPEVDLKGEALDTALEERGLPKTGSADERRARVAEHDTDAKTEGQV